MKKLIPLLFALFLLPPGMAQEANNQPNENAKVSADDLGLVSVDSKGSDVRSVLHDMFKQAKKSYVLEPNVRFVLYLNLTEVEFEEALQIVCKQASLGYEKQNGIYYVGPKKALTKANPEDAKAPEVKPTLTPDKPKSKGKLSPDVLLKKVTTLFNRTSLRKIIADLAKQTGVEIVVADEVYDYKMDAHLVGTTLKYALDMITDATKLKYEFTDTKTLLIKTVGATAVSIAKD